MNAYKVVDKNRNSCIVHDSKWEISYIKGKTVKAIPGTIGIMCFDTEEHADVFIVSQLSAGEEWEMIEVEGFNRKHSEYCACTNSYVSSFYVSRDTKYIQRPLPTGTLLFDSVEVLT